jgi:hypothetical protein
MSPYDGKKFIFGEKTFGKLKAKEIRTPSHIVIFLHLGHDSSSIVNGVCPHQIAEDSTFWNLSESINFLYAIQLYNKKVTFLTSEEIPP